ncbi:unnamed protein product [Caenorhabditis nigoni]
MKTNDTHYYVSRTERYLLNFIESIIQIHLRCFHDSKTVEYNTNHKITTKSEKDYISNDLLHHPEPKNNDTRMPEITWGITVYSLKSIQGNFLVWETDEKRDGNEIEEECFGGDKQTE